MPLPQFTIRDLLLSTALIVAGIGAFYVFFRGMQTPEGLFFGRYMVVVFFSSGALVGAGIGRVFGRLWFWVGGLFGSVLLPFAAIAVIRRFF